MSDGEVDVVCGICDYCDLVVEFFCCYLFFFFYIMMWLLLVTMVLLVMKWLWFDVRKVMYFVMFLGLVVRRIGICGICLVN